MKKLVALLLCLMLVVNFAACGGKEDEKGGNDTPAVTLADGTYTKTADEASNGYKDTVTMVVEGGKITSLVWDGIAEDGSTKRDAVAAGNYTMPGELSWSEQADAIAADVIANQGLANVSNMKEGKIDTVSGVTMGVSWFVGAVGSLIEEATK